MLILLDIDGVMIPAKSWSAPPVLEDGFSVFNAKSVDALNQIIERSKADILLTTSHKGRFTIDKWISIFENRGVVVNGLDRLSIMHSQISRKEEITNWFSNTNNVDDFVILDDDSSLNGLSPFLKTRLVLTKPLIGLTNAHIEESLRILNTPLELA